MCNNINIYIYTLWYGINILQYILFCLFRTKSHDEQQREQNRNKFISTVSNKTLETVFHVCIPSLVVVI